MPTDTHERIAIVADDSPLIRDYVRSALGRLWRIYPVGNGVEAVEYARTARPQLIVLDVRMPRMDGIQACRLIRASFGCIAVPIVILTAYDDPPLRQRARRAGATTVVAKPFTFESLRVEIDNVLTATPMSDNAPADATNAGSLDDRAILQTCRRAEAAAEAHPYESFSETMEALRAAERF